MDFQESTQYMKEIEQKQKRKRMLIIGIIFCIVLIAFLAAVILYLRYQDSITFKMFINNKKVLKALKNSLMDSSPMVRINAIEAIMNSGDEASIDYIRPSLQDEDDEVKKNALIALYNLIGRDILDEVIDLPIYNESLKNEAQALVDEYEGDENDN